MINDTKYYHFYSYYLLISLLLISHNGFSQHKEKIRGQKKYEISNHLGNVLATVSDSKLAVDDGSINAAGFTDYYKADVLSSQDYYAFGAIMPERDSVGYPFGFQGQEQDDEVKGKGNSINYKYRMHDARLGRFFAVDPLVRKYPSNTPYAFSENKIVVFIELEGLETFTNLSLAEKNTGYNVVLVVSTMRDEVIERDYSMALDLGIPILEVAGIEEFRKGVSQLNSRGISVNTYAFTAHGNRGTSYIGGTRINADDDFKSPSSPNFLPNLTTLTSTEFCVFTSCFTGAGSEGELFTQKVSDATGTETITSLHLVQAGIEFDGSNLNNYFWKVNYDEYRYASPKAEETLIIEDVSIDAESLLPVKYEEKP